MRAVLTVAQMRLADASTIASGTPGSALMERAGAAVAYAMLRRFPHARRVLVLAGPGNNGGDGFVAARHLVRFGRSVRVALFGERAALTGDAARAADAWRGPVLAPEAIDLAATDVVVDALFGAGLARPLNGAAGAIAERLAASRLPVLAVDVPSGLDGDGRAIGGVVVRADVTVTFVRRKPGHLLLPGRILCGEVEVADIGIPDALVDGLDARTFENEPGLWRGALPTPAVDGHKYRRGHVLVLSGPELATGAARLAATAALRSGAGLVTLAGEREALRVHAAHVTSIMLAEASEPAALGRLLEDPRYHVVVVGPGAGTGASTRGFVEAALAAGRPLVMDADAITAFRGDADALAALIAASGAPVVLTPHTGEFARLFEPDGDIRDAETKLAQARRAAERLGAVVVLKGPDTVVAARDGFASIAANASPSLATAGSGDVLAGIIGGLLAQGMPAPLAASAGVWIHGDAAVRYGRGLIAEDLPGLLPDMLRDLS
jgi:hydroxyethylthiazole kinase-like uncharacterized protein yjeF